MRRVSFILAVILVASVTTARAQTPLAGTAPKEFYGEFAAGMTVGHTFSSALNVELGKRLNDGWDVYLELGRMTDTRTADLDAAAQVIVTYLGSTATATPEQPVNFGDIGVHYKFPTTGRIQPYAGVGVGIAKVTRNVVFAVNGVNQDSSSLLNQYGVQLGSDLSGATNKALLAFVFGGQVPFSERLFADFAFHFGRVFLPDGGLNTTRVQAGIGVRF